jgi:hypothetical protein
MNLGFINTDVEKSTVFVSEGNPIIKGELNTNKNSRQTDIFLKSNFLFCVLEIP